MINLIYNSKTLLYIHICMNSVVQGNPSYDVTTRLSPPFGLS